MGPNLTRRSIALTAILLVAVSHGVAAASLYACSGVESCLSCPAPEAQVEAIAQACCCGCGELDAPEPVTGPEAGPVVVEDPSTQAEASSS